MKACYIDTSVLVGLLLEEKHFDAIEKHFLSFDEILSSNLTEAELCSVGLREKLNYDYIQNILNHISIVSPGRRLIPEFKKIYDVNMTCKGADLYHIAVSLYLDPKAQELKFFTLDEKQAKIAQALGFRIVKL